MAENQKLKAAERIAAEIKRRIATGFYPAQAFMPSERQLSAELDTSRTTVSAALSMLTAEGLTEQITGRGTRVLPLREAVTPTVVAIVQSRPGEGGILLGSAHARVVEGIRDALARTNYAYALVSSKTSDIVDDIKSGKYAAVIFGDVFQFADEIVELEKQKFPVVVANLELDLDVTGTWVDYRKTTAQAVRMLVCFGHKQIAFLTTNPGKLFYRKALDGYLIGLEEAGIVRDDSLIVTVEQTNPLLAYDATQALLRMPNPPTAIVAARDTLAEGACHAITKAGKIVGRDISVIGFDDTSWLGEPFLTTFREPFYEMGSVAAEMLIDRLVNGWRPPERRELEAPLVLRQSAGPHIK